MTPVYEQLYLLATALAIGLLIGAERGWAERDVAEGQRIAGFRTYGLIGLLGGVCGLLAQALNVLILGFGFLGLVLLLTVAYIVDFQRDNDVSITSLVAGLLTFALGALAALGHVLPAAASAVVTTVLLGYKPQLHFWLKTLEQRELKATMQLLLISVVMLPLLPNQGYGPWRALNPYEIWWMVVLIASISFSGYFAMKFVGERKGIVLTSLFAGLASSTALTLHFSRLAQSRPHLTTYLAAGILIACGTMFPRMVVVAGLINPALLPIIIGPALLMAALTYGSVVMYWFYQARTSPPGAAAGSMQNPLEFGVALRFGALLAAVVLLTRALQDYLGEAGILLMAALSGVADVDAINLTLSRMSNHELATELAATGIIIASAANSLVKGVLTASIGGRTLGLRVALPLLVAAGAGLAVVALPYLRG
ncbi:MAG: MgtC/SapB family protein [Candidatus Competibacteraceae bacterium]|jgi:uncharacterized membrane protein (DUF4010 family)|nr:MgtC/SapB family protein [Candidatus Competibacteraceae bacterium]